MSGQEPGEELILRSSRWKNAFWFLGTLGITIFYGYYVPDCLLMWLFAAGSGLFALIFLARLVFNLSYLRLTRRGFYQHGRLVSTFFTWGDVKDFRVGSKPWMVVFDFTNADHPAAVRKLARFVAACDGALPETYGLPASDLARLMNEWRERFGAGKNPIAGNDSPLPPD